MTHWELDIQRLGPKADGIHESPEGQVYVDRALPGDVVHASVRPDRAGLYRGEIVRIVTPSPHRQPSPCRHYDRCGNCTLLHVTPAYYRQWKIALLDDALRRQRLVPARRLEPVFLGTGNRRRATFAAYRLRKKVVLGYYRRRSKEITPIDECLVAHPKLLAVREAVRPYLAKILVDGGWPTDVFLQLVGESADLTITGPVGRDGTPDLEVEQAVETLLALTPVARVSWRPDEEAPLSTLGDKDPAKNLAATFGKLRVPLPPAAFLQPTEEGERALVSAVLLGLPEAGRFADFFSGCGTFTGPMLERGPVDAFEAAPAAVKALERAEGAERLKAYRRDLFRTPLHKELSRYDAVVLDPPRGGAVEQASALSQSAVPVVILVSCNPATFARDARWLVGGGYLFESLQLVDQFVGSHHVEVVGVFTKRSGR